MYLNTGLTSTKNYGKTILTKVGSSDNHSNRENSSTSTVMCKYSECHQGESLYCRYDKQCV